MKGGIKCLVYLRPRSQEVSDLAGRCPDQLTHQDQVILGCKRGFSYTQNWHPGSLAFWLGAEHVHSKCSVRCSPDSFLPLTLQWPTRLQNPMSSKRLLPAGQPLPIINCFLTLLILKADAWAPAQHFERWEAKVSTLSFSPLSVFLTPSEASETSCSKE